MHPLRIHAPRSMNLFHLDPLLALRLALLDPQFLEVHVRAVEDGACVARIRTFLGAEGGELGRLGLLGCQVVRCRDFAEERGLCDGRLFEVRVYLSTDFVACILVLSAFYS